MSDRQKRSHKQINYNEKAPVVGGGAPAWVKLQSSQAELIKSERKLQGKENSKDPSANQQHPEGTQAKKQAKPAAGSGKAAKAQKIPQRGRDAGIEHVPIVDKAKQALDAKAAAGVPQPQAASGRLRRGASAGTGSGEDSERERPRLVPREVPVPGLPHVRQKRLDPAPKAAASAEPATAAESNPAAPPEQPEQQQQHASDDDRAPSNSGKQGSAGSGRKGNGGKSKHLKIASSGRKRAASDPGVRAAEKQPAAKRQRARSSGGHKVTAAAEPRKGGEEQALPSAHLAAGASNAARGAIVVTPPQQLQPEHASAGVVGGPAVEPDMAAGQGNRAADVLERATRAVQVARQAEEAAAAVPPPQSCQLCHHFSDNFAALITEFQELQRQYEALKKGRLEAELEAVLKEQNRKVQEHGMRAGELAKAWKEEADKRAADAEQYTGLLARCQELEGEVLQAQAELTEVQAASLAKDTRIRELETSLQLLQRHVRVPQTHDQDIQTGGPAALSAGVQAPSLQPASSPGVQMLEARALAPEGALGTVYKKGRPSAWRGEEGSAAGAPADVTYSLPATTLAPALAARLAGEAEPEQHLLQGEQGAAGSVHGQTEVRQQQVLSPQHYQQENELYQDQGGPAVVGAGAATSDMQLTGEPQPPTAAQAAAGTGHEERMPVAGRLAHAAAASRPGVRRASLAPAPVLSSPLPPAQQQAAAAVAVQPERPPSAQETAESLMHAAPGPRQDVLLPHMPAQPRGRRLSAPPVFGGFTVAAAAPLERQLQFTASISPQQQTAGGMLGRLATLAEAEEEGEQGQTGAPVPASVPPPPREGAVMMLGFEATPCKGGKYIFTDRPSGFAFELGPALPDVPGSDEEEAPPSTGAGTEPELCYKALNVGSIGHVLPEFLHGQILIKAKFRSKLLHLITEALAKATPGPQQR